MRIVSVIILCLFVGTLSPAVAGNKKMVEERTRELDELNQQAVKQVPNLPENGRVELKAKGTYRGDEVDFDVIDYRIDPGAAKPEESGTGDDALERATPVENKTIDLGENIRKNSRKGEAIENATSND